MPIHIGYHKCGSTRTLFGEENVMCVPMEHMVSERQEFVERLQQFAETDIPGALPFDDPAKGGLRYIELKTRYLNLLRRPHSVNGYILGSGEVLDSQVRLFMFAFAPLATQAR